MTTFSKLRSGAWGIRSTLPLAPGERVTVERRDGSRSTVTVDRVVWSGGGVWLAAIAAEPRRAAEPAPAPADDVAARHASAAAAMSAEACGGDTGTEWASDIPARY